MTAYLVGLGAMAVLVAAWLAVQVAWRRIFPAGSGDPDALAGRMGCAGCSDCGRTGRCPRHGETAPRAGEETR